MEKSAAIMAFKALAQDSRLAIFRLLVMAAPAGLPARVIASRQQILPSTLSGHLALLHRAGLVRARRDGREIIYTAQLARIGALVDFLLLDCCNGRETECMAKIARDRLVG